MFLWEDSRYLPYIKINSLKIDNHNLDLSEKNDWRLINKLIIKKYDGLLDKHWEDLEMNVSICIDDESGGRKDSEQAKLVNRKMKLLKDGVIQNISLKVVSSSSKTYKSFDLLDFDSETDGLPILSWSGDINISSLHLAENLYLLPSVIGKVNEFGDEELNLAGGDSFIKSEGFLISFDDPEDSFGGKDIKLIKLDFNKGITENGENYKAYIPKRVVNETHYINADIVNNEEPIIFVNTGIEEIKRLYSFHSSGAGLNTF